jgi:hypothetical protein
MVGVKCNLAALGNALAYKITENTDGVPYIAWQKEPRTLDAEDVLGGNKREKRERAEKVDEAVDWLRSRLANAAKRQDQLKTDAEHDGISWRTLRRAKDHLRVKSRKDGFAGGWLWELPEDAQGDQILRRSPTKSGGGRRTPS